jgi:hypothetical protein
VVDLGAHSKGATGPTLVVAKPGDCWIPGPGTEGKHR